MRKLAVMVSVLLVSLALVFAQSVVSPVKLQPTKEKLAFPMEEAGFGCWIKLDKSPDLKAAGKALEQILQVSDSHVYGWTTATGPARIKVHIYVDVQGYIAAFLPKDALSSQIVDFYKNTVSYFTITKALENVLVALGYLEEEIPLILSNVKFADFAHPDANEFVVVFSATKPITKAPKKYTVEDERLHIAMSKKAKIYSYSIAYFAVLEYYICT